MNSSNKKKSARQAANTADARREARVATLGYWQQPVSE